MIASVRGILILAVGAGILAPVCALGHSTEFILAKVTPENGRVQLELTADYGGNPMFVNEADARAVLNTVLRVRIEGKNRDLAALAPIRFETRTQFDPTTPIPMDPVSGAEPHQLLCAIWLYKCPAEKVAFEMPSDAGQSMILWTPPTAAGKKPRWVFLLPGETSPEITIPHQSIWSWLIVGVGIGFLGVSVPFFRICLRKV